MANHAIEWNQQLDKSYTTYSSNGVNFAIQQRYEVLQVLGKGLYGTVCLAVDKLLTAHGSAPCNVAIKKVSNIFNKEVLMKRAVRELKLMRHFRGHKNVCGFSCTPHIASYLTNL